MMLQIRIASSVQHATLIVASSFDQDVAADTPRSTPRILDLFSTTDDDNRLRCYEIADITFQYLVPLLCPYPTNRTA
jgi:hypothetical protein